VFFLILTVSSFVLATFLYFKHRVPVAARTSRYVFFLSLALEPSTANREREKEIMISIFFFLLFGVYIPFFVFYCRNFRLFYQSFFSFFLVYPFDWRTT